MIVAQSRDVSFYKNTEGEWSPFYEQLVEARDALRDCAACVTGDEDENKYLHQMSIMAERTLRFFE